MTKPDDKPAMNVLTIPVAPKPPRLSLLEREALRLAKATATHERNVARSKARTQAERVRKSVMAADDDGAIALAEELVAMLRGLKASGVDGG